MIIEKKPAKRAKLNSTDSKEQTGKEVDQNANMEWVRILTKIFRQKDPFSGTGINRYTHECCTEADTASVSYISRPEKYSSE